MCDLFFKDLLFSRDEWGLGPRATNMVGKSESIERQTKTLLVYYDLLKLEKHRITPALPFNTVTIPSIMTEGWSRQNNQTRLKWNNGKKTCLSFSRITMTKIN